MSTHVTKCVVCGGDCYCTDDAYALGCGGKHGEGGCTNPPYIQFCSAECFVELRRRLDEQRVRLIDDPEFADLYAAIAEAEKKALRAG